MTETKRKYTPPTGRVISFQLTLNPTSEQVQQFQSHLGAVRYAYNWTLDLLQNNYEAAQVDPTIEQVKIGHTPILKLWTQAKNEVAPWWSQNAKEAYDTGILNAVTSYQNFFNSVSGKRKGPKMGYPRFKKRTDEAQIGCMFNVTVRLDKETKHVYLSRIGKIRYHGNAASIKWLLSNGARITQGWLKYNHTRWTLTFTLRVPDKLAITYYKTKYKKDVKVNKRDRKAVGVDLGLKTFATQSDGIQLPNPRFLRKAERKLKRQQRALARKRDSFMIVKDPKTGEEHKQWSKRRIANQKQIAKTHARVYNLRNEFTHQYSIWLVKNYYVLCFETLSPKNMLQNRHLSKSVHDAAWGSLFVKLKYKTENTQFLNTNDGVELRQVGRFEPSSKRCSRCQEVRTKLSLNERIFVCPDCGFTMDRDLNGSHNMQYQLTGDLTEASDTIRVILRPRVAGESKIGQTGAYFPSLLLQENRLDPELNITSNGQDKLPNIGVTTEVMLHKNTL